MNPEIFPTNGSMWHFFVNWAPVITRNMYLDIEL